MTVNPPLPMISDTTEDLTGLSDSSQSDAPDQVTCWLVDTRKLWPGDKIATAQGAAQVLSLISCEERQTIIGKVFIQDARMSLASALLKRLYICKTLGIRWQDVHLGRRDDPKNGKPCALDAQGRPIPGIDFNVSHQGGLVALVGYDGRPSHDFSPASMVYGLMSSSPESQRVSVGVDIVCVNERDDYRTIDAEGMDGWVDVYDFVFSAEERWSMKYDVDYVTMLDGTHLSRDEIGRHDRCITRHKNLSLTSPSGRTSTFSSERIIEAKLRRFYAYFCYKEAFIKVSGEALLAPWLRQLEFFNVRSPKPGTPLRCSTHGAWGETVDDVEVMLHKRPVSDVKMKLQAFEEDFMLATAMQGDIAGVEMPAFTTIDLLGDIRNYTSEWSGRYSRATSISNSVSSSRSNSRSNSSTRISMSSRSSSSSNMNGLGRRDSSSGVKLQLRTDCLSSSPSKTQLHIDMPSRGNANASTSPRSPLTPSALADSRKMHELAARTRSPSIPGTPGTPDNPYAHMNEVPLCLM